MFKNPLSQERLEKLQEDAQDFFKLFGPPFAFNYGRAMFEKAKSDTQENPREARKKLARRDVPWYKVPREYVYTGHLYVRKGAGAGNFSDAKKYFVVEGQDYNIELYKDEAQFQSGGKPETSIQPAGYKVVVNVAKHYQQDRVLRGLGMTDEEVIALTADLSSSSFALVHPLRTNYVFQLNPGADSGCCGCCGGGGNTVAPIEEELSAEASAQRQAALDAIRDCVYSARPRDPETVVTMAFVNTCKELAETEDKLKNWDDDGTESEMLLSCLWEYCIPELRNTLLKEMPGPTLVKLKMWYTCQGMMVSTLSKATETAWGVARVAIDEVQKQIEPVILAGMSGIARILTPIENKIKAAVLDKIASSLAKNIAPQIEPTLKAFEQPSKDIFQSGRLAISEKVKLTELPTDAKKRKTILDRIPLDKLTVRKLRAPLNKLSEALTQLKETNPIYKELDVKKLQRDVEALLLETIDSAVYTLEKRLEDGDKQQDALLDEVLLNYDHDVQIAWSIYIRDAMTDLFTPAFKELTKPVTEPMTQKIDDAIPDPFNKFVSVEQIFDDFIIGLVGEVVNKSVDKVYPPPAVA